MAEFNNKKPYVKNYGNDNRHNNNKKPRNYSENKDTKDFKRNYFDKDYDENPREFRKSYKKPAVPQNRAPVNRPRGVEAPEGVIEVIEYKMAAGLAETILKMDKSKRSPQEVLCEYVNTQCGLKGYCVRVSYF